MKATLELLKKYKVTEYELVTWLSSALEYKIGDDDYTKRLEYMTNELDALSRKVYEGGR